MVESVQSSSAGNESLAAPPIGVVIPTYNRIDALLMCLECLEKQTIFDFEVVIVDDGSSDQTTERIEQFQHKTPLQVRYVRQPNSGPARARNRGVSLLRAPLCLFIGDDIFAAPNLVETHLKLHQVHPDPKVAGLGLTQWSETGQTVTTFMRWLDSSGTQFAYGDLLNGCNPDWKHFYTSNLSVKTELLKAYPFYEAFPSAAFEDMELGYRIQTKHGLELVFIPDAVAYHLHPTSFRAACKRMLKVGEAATIFYRLWPELRPPGPSGAEKALLGILNRNRWLFRPLVFLSDCLTRLWCPNPLMKATLAAHFMVGSSQNRRSC